MATKEEIKVSALYCFAHYGYEGTTMCDIAKAVGLKKQSLYSHFGSKEELYLTVLREQGRLIFADLNCAIERHRRESAEELLKAIFCSLVDTFSVRERLLLWKRTFIYYGSGDNVFIKDTSEWHFDSQLKDGLYDVMKDRYPNLADTGEYQAFFISYTLMIQGYLDWMVAMGHNVLSWQTVWKNYWHGARSFCR